MVFMKSDGWFVRNVFNKDAYLNPWENVRMIMTKDYGKLQPLTKRLHDHIYYLFRPTEATEFSWGGKKKMKGGGGGRITGAKTGSYGSFVTTGTHSTSGPHYDYREELKDLGIHDAAKITHSQIEKLIKEYGINPQDFPKSAPKRNNVNQSPNSLNKVTYAAGPLYANLTPLFYMGKLDNNVNNKNFSGLTDHEKEVDPIVVSNGTKSILKKNSSGDILFDIKYMFG